MINKILNLFHHKHKKSIMLFIVITLCFTLSYLLSVFFPDLFQLWNSQVSDQFFHIRYSLAGKEEISPHLVHIFLTDSDVDDLHISLWDRNIFGRMIKVLNTMDVAAIACDIFFQDKSNHENDQLLLEIVRESGHIYFPLILNTNRIQKTIHKKVLNKEPETLLNMQIWYPVIKTKGYPLHIVDNAFPVFTDLGRVVTGMGHINCEPDADGFNRSFPLLYKYKEGYIPALSLLMICNYFKVNPENIEVYFGKKLVLKEAHIAYSITEDIVIPIDAKGRIPINYIGPWTDSFVNFRFTDVFAAAQDEQLSRRLRETIRNSLILISDVSTRNKDYGPAVFDTVYPLSGIHLNVMNAILSRNFLIPANSIITIITCFLLAISLWLCGLRLRFIPFIVISFLVYIVFSLFSVFAFIFVKQLTLVIQPTLAFLLSIFCISFYQFIQLEKQKSVFLAKTRFWIKAEEEKMELIKNILNGITPPVEQLLAPLKLLSAFTPEELTDQAREKVMEMKKKAEQLKQYIEEFLKKAEQEQLDGISFHSQENDIESEEEKKQERLENSYLQLTHPEVFSAVITQNSTMIKLFSEIETIAESSIPILILGESGVGKELIAEAIHSLSGCKGMFIPVNTAGLDDSMFSDTLFGHTKGSYTGADFNREGLISSAEQGTLFLDEIGDLSLASQVKLLRLLEKGEYRCLGDNRILHSTARIVAATNADLESRQRKKLFRNDLFFRFTHRLIIPPLRERLDDLRLLVNHFIVQAARKLSRPIPKIPKKLIALLESYEFPGNIRELAGMIDTSLSKSPVGEISLNSIRQHILNQTTVPVKQKKPDKAGEYHFTSNTFLTLEKVEEIHILAALKKANGNQVVAAKMLGLTTSTLCRKLKRLKKFSP